MNKLTALRTSLAVGALTLVAVGCKEGTPVPVALGQEPTVTKPPASATAEVTKIFTPLPS